MSLAWAIIEAIHAEYKRTEEMLLIAKDSHNAHQTDANFFTEFLKMGRGEYHD